MNIQITNEALLEEIYSKYKNNCFSKYIGEDQNSLILVKEGSEKIPFYIKNENRVSFWQLEPKIQKVFKMKSDDFKSGDIHQNLLYNLRWEIEEQIIQAMGQAVTSDDSVASYGVSTGAQLDTWNTNNSDRILYGSKKSNMVAGNHTSSLAAITTASDKMSAGVISLAKRMAKTADPHIAPLRTSGDQEWFVIFCDPFAFRDLKNDPIINHANRDLWIEKFNFNKKDEETDNKRSYYNPITTGNNFIYDGVILVETPEISCFINHGAWGNDAQACGLNIAGANSTRVGVSFLCGAQSVASNFIKSSFYERNNNFQSEILFELKNQIRKTSFNGKQYGIMTIFTSSALDK